MNPSRILIPLVLTLLACSCGNRVKERWIKVADSKVYVEDSGRGETLILLHGGTLDHRMWEEQVKTFRKHFRVLNIDIRGHGRTKDGDSSYLASDALVTILDTLHITRAHVAGLSLGAVVATGFAIDHPARLNKLVLASPGLIGFEIHHDSVYRKLQTAMQDAYSQHDTLAYIENFVRAWTDGPQRTPEGVDADVRDLTLKMTTENVFRNKWRYNPGFAFKPLPIKRLSSIASTTLVMVGELDMVDIRMIADTLVDKIPYARKIVIPQAAHMVNLEQPELFNATVLSFLRDDERFAALPHVLHGTYLATLQ